MQCIVKLCFFGLVGVHALIERTPSLVKLKHCPPGGCLPSTLNHDEQTRHVGKLHNEELQKLFASNLTSEFYPNVLKPMDKAIKNPMVVAGVYGLLGASSLLPGAMFGMFAGPKTRVFAATVKVLGSGAIGYSVSTSIFEDIHDLLQGASKSGDCQGDCPWRFREVIGSALAVGLAGSGYLCLVYGLLRCTKHQTDTSIPTTCNVIESSRDAEASSEIQPRQNAAALSLEKCSPQHGMYCSPCNSPSIPALQSSLLWFAICKSVLLDRAVEALLIGLMSDRRNMGLQLLLAIALANFPEAFHASGVMVRSHWPVLRIFVIWLLVVMLSGLLALLAALARPSDILKNSPTWQVRWLAAAVLQGILGGAMLGMNYLTCYSEDFKLLGFWMSGAVYMCGFAFAVLTGTMEYRVDMFD